MPQDTTDSDELPPTVLASDALDERALEIDVDDEDCVDGTLVGRYEIREEIARGGMGIVYRSRDAALDRDVAIKILRSRFRNNVGLRQRFLDEARVIGQLQHPGIVPIYEVGASNDGRPFFAMKLVEGETLSKLVSHSNRMERERSRQLTIFHQVCQTIAFAHSRGLIHLDLKPSNVMVGKFGEVLVVDWGLCRRLSHSSRAISILGTAEESTIHRELSESEVDDLLADLSQDRVLGTPAYMAPEQARGEAVGPLSDVFGLGAILCEILVGHPPFQGKSLRDVYKKCSRGEMGQVIKALHACGCEEPLLQLVKQCLSIDPADRPIDAGFVATEVGVFLESALQRAEHDLARFFEISMDMFCIASLDGFFKRVNSNFSRVLGFSNAELVSRPFMDYVHPDDIDSTIDAMKTLGEGNPVVRFRNRYRDSDGNYHWMEWTAKSIPEENIVFAVARDVTDSVEPCSG